MEILGIEFVIVKTGVYLNGKFYHKDDHPEVASLVKTHNELNLLFSNAGFDNQKLRTMPGRKG